MRDSEKGHERSKEKTSAEQIHLDYLQDLWGNFLCMDETIKFLEGVHPAQFVIELTSIKEPQQSNMVVVV